VPIPLSPHSPKIAAAHDLRRAPVRRERGRFIIEGPTLLDEALRSGIMLEELFGTAEALAEHASLVARAERAGSAAYSVPDRALARISDLETSPGLAAIAAIPSCHLADLIARPGPVLLLAGVGDPGNAGTLVRSAEAFGAAGVVFGRGGVDPYSPKVVRAAMGSLFRVPVAQANADELLVAAAQAGRPVVATQRDGAPLAGAGLDARVVVAVGHERHGVESWLPRWDQSVGIEQMGALESLNAAVAGSIILYEISRPRTT
jgi:TrmH family RNA methyltransferase